MKSYKEFILLKETNRNLSHIDKINESAIMPYMEDVFRLINSEDFIGLRKTLNDIIVQYKEGGLNQPIIKNIISYITSILKKHSHIN